MDNPSASLLSFGRLAGPNAAISNTKIFFEEIQVHNVEQFIGKVKAKLPITGNNIQRAGACVLQDLIVNKIEGVESSMMRGERVDLLQQAKIITGDNSLTQENYKERIDDRLSYFQSSTQEFISNFCDLTFPEDGTFRNESAEKKKSQSYTVYLRTLFKTTIETTGNKIRTLLEGKKAAAQCNTIIGAFKPQKCYLCGCQMSSGHSVECEHILPIVPALSHLWLDRGDGSADLRKSLSIEYAWSHECCNQLKLNKNFIKYNTDRYIIDEEVISEYYNLFNEAIQGKHHNCDQIKDFPCVVPGETGLLHFRLTEILKQINSNLTLVSQADLTSNPESIKYFYVLICQFRLISAFSDMDFINKVLLGWEPSSELSEAEKELKTKILELSSIINSINIEIDKNQKERVKNFKDNTDEHRRLFLTNLVIYEEFLGEENPAKKAKTTLPGANQPAAPLDFEDLYLDIAQKYPFINPSVAASSAAASSVAAPSVAASSVAASSAAASSAERRSARNIEFQQNPPKKGTEMIAKLKQNIDNIITNKEKEKEDEGKAFVKKTFELELEKRRLLEELDKKEVELRDKKREKYQLRIKRIADLNTGAAAEEAQPDVEPGAAGPSGVGGGKRNLETDDLNNKAEESESRYRLEVIIDLLSNPKYFPNEKEINESVITYIKNSNVVKETKRIPMMTGIDKMKGLPMMTGINTMMTLPTIASAAGGNMKTKNKRERRKTKNKRKKYKTKNNKKKYKKFNTKKNKINKKKTQKNKKK